MGRNPFLDFKEGVFILHWKIFFFMTMPESVGSRVLWKTYTCPQQHPLKM